MTLITANSTPTPAEKTNRSSPISTLSQANSAVATNDLLQMVLQLQTQILTISKPGGNTNAGANNAKKPKSTYIRNQTNKYCWSHGACGHEGKYCRNKKDGHKDNATFGNKMGGSTDYCNNVTEAQNNEEM